MALIVKKAVEPNAVERWEGFEEGVSFKLASLDSKEYQIGLERARRLIAKADAGQSLSDLSVTPDDAKEFDIQCQLVGRFIIRDWKGEITGEDGTPTGYSADAAINLLRDNPALLAWAITAAAKIAADVEKERTATVGKPSTATDGKPNAND